MTHCPLVCVRRNEPALSAVFQEMYQNERLVDVTLSCGDGQIHAHKLVLSACSAYFRNLFEKLANPFHYPVIVLKDMPAEDLKLIVDFMYRGEITIPQDRFLSLIRSADNLQINGLSGPLQGINWAGDATTAALAAAATTTNSVTATSQQRRAGLLGPSANSGVATGRFKKNVRKQTGRANGKGRGKDGTGGVDIQDGHPSHLDAQQLMVGNQPNYSLDEAEPARILEQSMVTGDTSESPHFPFDQPSSSRNIAHNQGILLGNSQQANSHLNSHLDFQHVTIDCKNSSQQSSQVLSQSLTANRARNHQCNVCMRTFREKANLKRHQQIHSQNRCTFVCNLCKKTFSWKDNYIRHTKTAHHQNNVLSNGAQT